MTFVLLLIGKSRSFTCVVIAERRLLIPVFCWLFSSLIDIGCSLLISSITIEDCLIYWVGHDHFLPIPVFMCSPHEIYFSVLLLLRLSSLYGTPLNIAYSADLMVMNCLSLCLKCLLLYQFWKTVFLEITLLFHGYFQDLQCVIPHFPGI